MSDFKDARIFLIKYGEIALKGKNRAEFEQQLERNICRQLPGGAPRVTRSRGRVYLSVAPEIEPHAARILSRTFGISSYAATIAVPKRLPALDAAALELARRTTELQPAGTFKIEARRADKSFGLTGYQICCRIGDLIRSSIPGLSVDVHNPDFTLSIEVREQIYLYSSQDRGPGGLPIGSSGKGLLLLSGGIDSPVAGYLIGKRGMQQEMAYFHAYPFTSAMAENKVRSLAQILTQYLSEIVLHVVPFTDIQLRIRNKARDEETTLLARACMMQIAQQIAIRRSCSCLITGESLGQVASQTVEALRFTDDQTELPVLRPLIGFDKEEIIARARTIGTFETSILPYPDCCTIFLPKHPLLRPNTERMNRSLRNLDLGSMIEEAATNARKVQIPSQAG